MTNIGQYQGEENANPVVLWMRIVGCVRFCILVRRGIPLQVDLETFRGEVRECATWSPPEVDPDRRPQQLGKSWHPRDEDRHQPRHQSTVGRTTDMRGEAYSRLLYDQHLLEPYDLVSAFHFAPIT
jgi:hypothetical protein